MKQDSEETGLLGGKTRRHVLTPCPPPLPPRPQCGSSAARSRRVCLRRRAASRAASSS